jgi:hypothetical protein
MRLIVALLWRLLAVGARLIGAVHVDLPLAGEVVGPVVLLHEFVVLAHVLHFCLPSLLLLSPALLHLPLAPLLHFPPLPLLGLLLLPPHVLLDLLPLHLFLAHLLLPLESHLLVLLMHLLLPPDALLFQPLHFLLFSLLSILHLPLHLLFLQPVLLDPRLSFSLSVLLTTVLVFPSFVLGLGEFLLNFLALPLVEVGEHLLLFLLYFLLPLLFHLFLDPRLLLRLLFLKLLLLRLPPLLQLHRLFSLFLLELHLPLLAPHLHLGFQLGLRHLCLFHFSLLLQGLPLNLHALVGDLLHLLLLPFRLFSLLLCLGLHGCNLRLLLRLLLLQLLFVILLLL